ncbi:hypothetical protein B0H16DRAFT_1450564 [Mycena metata]|uniref:Uncharacterized protein n=1 Tax=Mycena metata TaxID=1033252 RepID=A0AAD7NTG5_9AGAR|nr:hypothetical protein B0H16DRAFT_1450564 [Mycena metata]
MATWRGLACLTPPRRRAAVKTPVTLSQEPEAETGAIDYNLRSDAWFKFSDRQNSTDNHLVAVHIHKLSFRILLNSHCVKRPRRQVLPTSDDPMPIKVGIDQGCVDQRRQTVFPMIDRGRQTSAPMPTRPLNAVSVYPAKIEPSLRKFTVQPSYHCVDNVPFSCPIAIVGVTIGAQRSMVDNQFTLPSVKNATSWPPPGSSSAQLEFPAPWNSQIHKFLSTSYSYLLFGAALPLLTKSLPAQLEFGVSQILHCCSRNPFPSDHLRGADMPLSTPRTPTQLDSKGKTLRPRAAGALGPTSGTGFVIWDLGFVILGTARKSEGRA